MINNLKDNTLMYHFVKKSMILICSWQRSKVKRIKIWLKNSTLPKEVISVNNPYLVNLNVGLYIPLNMRDYSTLIMLPVTLIMLPVIKFLSIRPITLIIINSF